MSSYSRHDTSFASNGTFCAAWLYRPDSVDNPPIIVMAHGFAAIRALRLDAYAARFAQAGYAALVFDYSGWGDSAGEPRRVLDIKAQHADWRAAIAHARTIDGVDGDRLIAWGSSFGGGHALYLAARGDTLAAVIAQVPHINGPASAFARPPQLVARLILAGAYDQLGALLGREPYRVDAAGEPGSFAMLNSPDAAPMAKRLAGDRYEELLPENNVAARIALRVPFYSPGRHADRITAPTLIQLARHDIVTPYDTAMKAAKRIPNGEIHTYDCSHFEPYLEPHFSTVIADQIDFLNRHA